MASDYLNDGLNPIAVNYFNRGYTIEFISLVGNDSFKFLAYLKSFSDVVTPNWNSEIIYGRIDPIHTFKNSERKISFSIGIPSDHIGESKLNLQRLQRLQKFCYPSYSNTGNATTITDAPLIRIKFANLIGTGQDRTGGALLGIIGNATIDVDTDVGFYDKGTNLYAKVFTLSCDFSVLHEENPGWKINIVKENEESPQEKGYDGVYGGGNGTSIGGAWSAKGTGQGPFFDPLSQNGGGSGTDSVGMDPDAISPFGPNGVSQPEFENYEQPKSPFGARSAY